MWTGTPLHFFTALVLLELLPAKEMSRVFYSNEASHNRWLGPVMLLPQYAKKSQAWGKFAWNKKKFIHVYFYVCFKLLISWRLALDYEAVKRRLPGSPYDQHRSTCNLADLSFRKTVYWSYDVPSRCFTQSPSIQLDSFRVTRYEQQVTGGHRC